MSAPKRLAVLGHPVAHSRSPAIHAAFAQQTGQAVDYDARDVAPEALGDTLKALHAEGFAGLNLTLPHKTDALAHCESLQPRAEQAGAANTLLRADNGWVGANTDGDGFVCDLASKVDRDWRECRIVVLGSGGAARGLIAPLLELQPAELVVSGRSPWKPEKLADAFPGLRAATHLSLKGDRFDVVINATSIGHRGECLRFPFPLLADGAVCCDLNYGAAHTPFAQWADEQGAAQVVDGLGMLVQQAALAFELWCGVLPDAAPVEAVLRTPD